MQSANDGCIIVAEGMAGSEENFAKLMTDRARALGLQKSVFKNSTGLPAEGQVVTVRELAMLGLHMWKEYPELYKYYSQPEFKWNKINQRNRNPLLAMGIGADGMQDRLHRGIRLRHRRLGKQRRAARVRGIERHDQRQGARRGGAQADRLGHEGIRQEAAVRVKARWSARHACSAARRAACALKAKGPVEILVPDHQPRQDDRAHRL